MPKLNPQSIKALLEAQQQQGGALAAQHQGDCWDIFHAIAPHCSRLLLHGPPGTGKTRQAVAALCAGTNVDPMNVTLTEETPAVELRGCFIPKGGEFVWMDGPGTVAWVEGRGVVINEIDHASADTLSYMMNFLDDAEIARMTLPTGVTIRPEPGFRCIATMNGSPDDMPFALRDRFSACLLIDRPHPEAVARLPKELQAAAMEGAMLPPERRTSIRAWLAFAELSQRAGDVIAARAIFGDRAKDLIQAIKLAKAAG